MHIGRRQFVLATVAGFVATLTRSASGLDTTYDSRELARPALLDDLGPQAVGEIGRRYRELVPAEHGASSLRAAILDSGREAGFLRGRRRPPLATLVADDFADGRVVLVNGWLLSATEARQCALFSLQAA